VRYLRAVLAMLGFLWTLPNTVLGLALGALTFQRPRFRHGVVFFDGAGPRGAARLIRLFGYSATTLGVVIVAAEPVGGALLAHELHHVRQYRTLGPVFLPVYGVLFLRYGYRRHPMELAADRAAAAATMAAATPGGSGPRPW
jgi:hypothetical protein